MYNSFRAFENSIDGNLFEAATPRRSLISFIICCFGALQNGLVDKNKKDGGLFRVSLIFLSQLRFRELDYFVGCFFEGCWDFHCSLPVEWCRTYKSLLCMTYVILIPIFPFKVMGNIEVYHACEFGSPRSTDMGIRQNLKTKGPGMIGICEVMIWIL